MLSELPETVILRQLADQLWARLAAARREEAGYSTEAVIVTALLVAGAIVVVGIIIAKVTSAARGIKTR
jgi:hypothetical protein